MFHTYFWILAQMSYSGYAFKSKEHNGKEWEKKEKEKKKVRKAWYKQKKSLDVVFTMVQKEAGNSYIEITDSYIWGLLIWKRLCVIPSLFFLTLFHNVSDICMALAVFSGNCWSCSNIIWFWEVTAFMK